MRKIVVLAMMWFLQSDATLGSLFPSYQWEDEDIIIEEPCCDCCSDCDCDCDCGCHDEGYLEEESV